MAFDLQREFKTTALAAAVQVITGRPPFIERYDTYNNILLDQDQIKKSQDYLTKLIEGEPGEVRIDVRPVIMPVLWRKYWPLVVGIPGGLILLGIVLPRLVRKRKK